MANNTSKGVYRTRSFPILQEHAQEFIISENRKECMDEDILSIIIVCCLSVKNNWTEKKRISKSTQVLSSEWERVENEKGQLTRLWIVVVRGEISFNCRSNTFSLSKGFDEEEADDEVLILKVLSIWNSLLSLYKDCLIFSNGSSILD